MKRLIFFLFVILALIYGYFQWAANKHEKPKLARQPPIVILDADTFANREAEPKLPDESILWNLFHAQKYSQVRQQIKQLQRQFPKWQPPGELISALIGVSGIDSLDTAATGPGFKPNNPDERILWKLFHNKQYQPLKAQIQQLKQQFPQWQPPQDLINALQDSQRGSASAIPKKSASQGPDLCPKLSTRWQQAETLLKRHQPTKAKAIYQRIITECPVPNKMQTLEKASSRLPYPEFAALLQHAEQYLPSLYLDHLNYLALKNHYLSSASLSKAQHDRAVKRLSKLLDLFKDDTLAEVIGWRYFDKEQYLQAQQWFNKALAWNPSNQNAHYGLMLSLTKMGKYDQALALFSSIKQPSSKLRVLAADIYKAKAWQNLDRNQLAAATKYVLLAEKLNGADEETQELNAWIAHQRGDYTKAAKLFEELYQQTAKRKYARAYIQNQVRVDREQLALNAEQSQGLLLEEFKQFHSTELYERKQFLAAEKLSPGEFPQLFHIDSPYVDLGGNVRYKSGENGLGRLDIFKAPIAGAAFTINGDHTINLNLSRVQLYSGRPEKCVSAIGSLAPDAAAQANCAANPNTPFNPTQQLNDTLEIDFAYRKDGWFSPFIKVGSTPINGVIDPTITFDVGFLQQTNFGNWGLAAYSQPVRQSILSYTGIKDPYTTPGSSGLEWGRILRTGIKPTAFYRFNEHWNASGTLDLAILEGKNVASNSTIAVSADFTRNLDIEGFDYFNIGPSFSYEHFDKNLSHFTYGQGGYFSPDQYYTIGAGINFLTDEGKDFIVKGRLMGGYQDITDSSSPWFPLNNQAGGYYAASNRGGVAFNFELKGAWLLTPNLQLGAGTAIRKTNGFDDYTGGLFIKYFFNDRKATFSTDLPDSLFAPMY